MARASDVMDDPNATGLQDTSKEMRSEALEAAAQGAQADIAPTTEGAETTQTETTADEPTIAELREAAGEDGLALTDEELQAEWKRAVEAEAEPATEPLKLAFPLYDDKGSKIDDATKVAIADLLSGKYQFGYQAMGKEVRKNITDLLRVASNGHYNEHKMNRMLTERDTAYNQLQELKEQHEKWASDRSTVDRALLAATQGNTKPLEKIITDFATALMSPGSPEATGQQNTASLNDAGYQYFLRNVQPEAFKIAQDYKADLGEVSEVTLAMIQQEGQFLTKERLAEIMQYELPAFLEQNGYNKEGREIIPGALEAYGSGHPLESQVKELSSTVKELQAQLANSKMQALRTKQKAIPAAGGGSAPSAGESMPGNITTRQQMKDFLQSR